MWCDSEMGWEEASVKEGVRLLYIAEGTSPIEAKEADELGKGVG
jgi:hypothetical protein